MRVDGWGSAAGAGAGEGLGLEAAGFEEFFLDAFLRGGAGGRMHILKRTGSAEK